jgi:hypothetical protein
MKINFITFTGFNILLCCILLGDAFILPGNSKTVTVSDFYTKLTKAKRTSYYNYFIYTSDGSKYEVIESLYEKLSVTDSVKIFSSLILNMPMKIHYWRDGQHSFSKVGQLHTKPTEKNGLLISLSISVIVLIIHLIRPLKRNSPIVALQLISFGTSFTVFLFVIIEVLSI